jgi:hypothetical protein
MSGPQENRARGRQCRAGSEWMAEGSWGWQRYKDTWYKDTCNGHGLSPQAES